MKLNSFYVLLVNSLMFVNSNPQIILDVCKFLTHWLSNWGNNMRWHQDHYGAKSTKCVLRYTQLNDTLYFYSTKILSLC